MVNCYKNTGALQIDSCFPINFLPVTVKRESLQTETGQSGSTDL